MPGALSLIRKLWFADDDSEGQGECLGVERKCELIDMYMIYPMADYCILD